MILTIVFTSLIFINCVFLAQGFQDNDSGLSGSAIISNAPNSVKENETNVLTSIMSAAGDMSMEPSQSTPSLDEEIMPSDIPSENAPLVCHGITNIPPTLCDVSIGDKLMAGCDTLTASNMMDNGPSLAMDIGSSPVSADMQSMPNAPSEIPQKQIPSVCNGITNTAAPSTTCDVSIVEKLVTGRDASTAIRMMDNGHSKVMDTGSSPASADMQSMRNAPFEIPQKQIPPVSHSITSTPTPQTCDVFIVDKLMTGYDTSAATNMMHNDPSKDMDTGSSSVSTDMQNIPHVPSEITKKQVPLVFQGITNLPTSSFAFIVNDPITMNDATITTSMSMDDATNFDELSESDSLDALTDMPVDAVEDTPTQYAIDLSSKGFARLLDRNEIVPESPVKDCPAPLLDIRNIPSTSHGISGHPSKNGSLRPRTRAMYYAETSSSEDSGSEYECSYDEVDSDDSNVSLIIPPPSVGKLKSTPDACCVVSSTKQSGENTQSSDVLIDDGSVKRKHGITIPTTHNIGQRKWDKVDYCIFCNEKKTKLCTHFKAKHSNEVDVIDWLQTKDNTLKVQKLKRMRNIGNHRHNCEVLRQGTGELIVTYRPSSDGIPANPDDYGPCPHCYAYFVKREMWKHRCPERTQTEAKKKRTVLKDSNLLVPSLKSGPGSEHLDRVLAGMKLDSVSRCVKSDRLIIDVAERECFKLGHNVEQDSYIRGKLRELGRLLLQLRETFGNPDACLEYFIYPEKFKTVIIAVRDMCGFSDQSHVYSTPSLALKVGHTLKKVATVLKGQGLENGDDSLYRRASAFHDLVEMRWTEEVSSHALRTLYSRKRNNAQILPLTADITCLANYTKKVASEQMSILKKDQNGDVQAAWVTLAEMSLTRIITFNRRRQGEASKMKLCDYTSNCSTGVQETALEETLTDFEKALCKSLCRVEIVGKRGNTVPVILTADMKQQVDMLNAKRDQVGISQDNPYIFARACKGSNSHIRGSDCLRKAAEACGAKQPQSLRSTKLRKHIATVSQVLHLNENELEVLAKFMGHDIRTHRAYYRLPDETMQLAKMSKFLLSLEKPGSLTALAGKSWKDMEIDEYEGRWSVVSIFTFMYSIKCFGC